MAKAVHGIVDPKKRTPTELAAAQIAAPPVPNRLVQITSIKNLHNVNALAEGQSLPIAPTGLTIIYGENGAGKSGYSRVLKKVCRARDQAEVILPDARKLREKSAAPEATFDAIVDGAPTSLVWNGGVTSPEQLSEISIFDSHCARAYLDNDGDFAYVPYGLDILEGLVKACGAVKRMAIAEKSANKVNLEPFALLSKTNTKTGRLLASLSAATNLKEIEDLANVTPQDLERLAILNKTLAEADPKQKAQGLRLRASRFNGLAERIASALAVVNDSKIQALRDLIEKSNRAKHAAELASKQFKNTPGLLPGTGSELWQDLFEAARKFSATAHAGHAFPSLPEDSACPLCQNTLGAEGITKLASFDAFIQQEAEKAAKAAKSTAAAAYLAIKDASIDLSIDDALGKELADAFPESSEMFASLQTAIQKRRAAAMIAAGGAIRWDDIATLPADPSFMLINMARALGIEAQALEESMDEKVKATQVAEQVELDARAKLAEIKAWALEAVEKLVLNAKLEACATAIVTTGISQKSTRLSNEMATQDVADALNAELRALNVHELQVVMKAETVGGKVQYKLAMQLPGGGRPSAILSEGEQRAIAIASFLAEVELGKGLGGIVFDDPVSSLDHRRRSHVATRLAEEAKHRQVIIFTHDIYFLCILQQEAAQAGCAESTQCIGRGQAGFGVQASRIPFDTLSTSKRVKVLRNMCDEVLRVHKTGDEVEATRLSREAYSHLRMAWERAVEEILFQSVITRFTEGVSTQRLKSVIVEDSDYDAIDEGMTKSSKFSGHDPAMSAQLATPHPDDLRCDIDKLEAWRVAVEARKAAIEARRK